VECDLTITKLSDEQFYFAAGGSTFVHDWRWINAELEKSGYRAALRDASDDYSMISVQGPYSKRLLSGLLDVSLDDEALPFSFCRHARLAGHDVMILRLTFIGEQGYELHVPSASAPHVYEALLEHSTILTAANIQVANAGYRAIDSMSAEKGYRHWHADLSNRDTPFEAGIGFVALAKLKTNAPFLGREALERQRAEGLTRRLVCLTLNEEHVVSPLHGQETIWRNNECVGFVKSAAYGFTVGKQIAYGYVDAPNGSSLKPKEFTEWLTAGEWYIGDKGDKRPSTLQLKSVFDSTNARVKGDYPADVMALANSIPRFELDVNERSRHVTT